jgi:catechol 2,3-dioxygenase-like lactoylglutathione lyase family enzyme
MGVGETPVDHRLVGIDHVQLAMPPGGEEVAAGFYEGVLGLARVPKPAALAARGGCWFSNGDVQIHLGVEDGFRAARKAHPALRVWDLDALVARIDVVGETVRWDDELPGVRRCYVDDPFGNRIELIESGQNGVAPDA